MLHARSFVLGAIVAAVAVAGVAYLAFPREGANPAAANVGNVAADASKGAERPISPAEGDARAPVGAARVPASSVARPAATDLARALASAKTRVEQTQAIAALLADGSAEAIQALLDAFLATDDPILLALLEEAILQSPRDMTPMIQAAFEGATDPNKLERLANMLRHAAAARPELADAIIGFLIRALDDPEGVRGAAASSALQALGRGAVDALAARLRDTACSPETAGTLAEILAKLPAQYGELVREKMAKGFESTRDVLSDPNATDATKDAARKKTGSLAWLASSRAPSEHDAFAPVLAEQLGRTTDAAQAGTLAWGLGQLRGLTDAGRAQTAMTLLGEMERQKGADVRLIMARSLVQMAQAGKLGSSDAVKNLAASVAASETDPKVQAVLKQLK